MTRFQTLMRREWMQHHRAWLLILLLPPVLMLLLLAFGSIQMDRFDALQMVVFATCLGTIAVAGIFTAATLLQLPGLARRDEQDRSIEFWLSLPASHPASVGATLVMHLLLMPLLALLVGYLVSQVLGLVLVSRAVGFGDWLGLPWGLLIVDGVLALLRLAFGGLLALFWLLPLLLLTMVASAWLKRWGTAVLVLALSLGHALLAGFYGWPFIGVTIRALTTNASHSIITPGDRSFPGDPEQLLAFLTQAPRLLLSDGLEAAANLGQPLALFAALFSTACFGLLVLRRGRRG